MTRPFPVRYNVGDRVRLTPECMGRMRWHARQAAHPGYPSDSFLTRISAHVGEVGTVTHTHPPGYEVTVEFPGGWSFHVKDNWVAMTLL